MLSPDEELLDLPSVPRVRKTTSNSVPPRPGDGADASRPASQQRPRKHRRRSRWSDATPSELPASHHMTIPKNRSAESERRNRPETSSASRAALTNAPSTVDGHSHRFRGNDSPPSQVRKDTRKRNRPRKVVNDDDDDDDDDEEGDEHEKDDYFVREDDEEDDIPDPLNSREDSRNRKRKYPATQLRSKSPSTDDQLKHTNHKQRQSQIDRSPERHYHRKHKIKKGKK